MNRTAFLALFVLGGVVAARAQFDANLVQNGSAESFTGTDDGSADFAGWTRSGNVFVNRYATHPLTYVGAAPTGTGLHYFLGGSPPAGSQEERTGLSQIVDLGFASTTVDAGRARFDLSAWFDVRDQSAGTTFPEDQVALSVQFLGSASSLLGTTTLGPYDGDRFSGDPTLFNLDVGFSEALSGAVPTGTRSVVVSQLYTRHTGTILNAGMDLVSFRVQSVPEPGSLVVLGLGVLAVFRRRCKG